MSETTDRPRSILEEIGDRCLQVVRDYADKPEDYQPGLRLIADFGWALGVDLNVSLLERAALTKD